MKRVNGRDEPVAVLYWLIGGPGPREAELADGRLKPWRRTALLPTTEASLQLLLGHATEAVVEGHRVLDGVALRVAPGEPLTDDCFPEALTAAELDARLRAGAGAAPPNA
jgi:hypothetical protein